MVSYTLSMAEVLTWDEIVAKYPDEWVLIDEPETTAGLDILGGRVIGHHEQLEVVERLDSDLRLRYSALLFTGPLTDPDMAYML